MAIDIEWQDERGARLLRYQGPPIDALPERASESSSCLRFIDPYGDTTFNARQVAVFEEELALLIDAEDEVAAAADALLSFVKQLEDRTHCYLKFIGD